MTSSTPLLDGAPNFRDLGGHRATDGMRIRPKQVFRSDALARLTDTDLGYLAALNIGLLYDLRSANERARHPNRWPIGKSVETISGSDSDELGAVRVLGWRKRIADPNFVAETARQWMLRAYSEMPRLFAGLLASVIDRVSAPSSPATLLLCTAGRTEPVL